jgi:hypothetical protein
MVEQISADFSEFLSSYRRISLFGGYFYKLLSEQLSRCKLIGVSALYKFVAQSTTPSFSEKKLDSNLSLKNGANIVPYSLFQEIFSKINLKSASEFFQKIVQ